jgi:hypothetical protein
MLSALYAAGLAAGAAGRVVLMNYTQLPEAASLQLLEWWGLTGNDDARQGLHGVAQFDAKTSSLPYDATELSTRAAPSQRAIDMAARFVAPYYARLESVRLAPIGRVE